MAKNLTYTSETVRNRRHTVLTVLVVAAALLVGVGSVFFLLEKNDYDMKKMLGMRSETVPTTAVQSQATLPALAVITAPKDEYNFLMVCEDAGSIAFMAEIGVSLSGTSIRVNAVSPHHMLEYNGKQITLAQMCAEYSYDLVNSYNENSPKEFDKYLRISASRFKKMMTELGAITVHVDEDIPYVADDVAYTFRAGDLALTSDLLLKYMTLSAQGEELLQHQEQALISLLKTHFTTRLANGGEAYFSKVISFFTTDISIYDYRNAADVLHAYLLLNPVIEAEK